MKRTMFALALGLCLGAVAGERMKIWPEGKMPHPQPHQIAAMTDEQEKGKEPYLEWFDPPTNPAGVCMILISGGAYENCCDVDLIRRWNELFTAAGCQCLPHPAAERGGHLAQRLGGRPARRQGGAQRGREARLQGGPHRHDFDVRRLPPRDAARH